MGSYNMMPGTWDRFTYLEGLDNHGELTKAEKKEMNRLLKFLMNRDRINGEIQNQTGYPSQ
jgi:hypothetical protein